MDATQSNGRSYLDTDAFGRGESHMSQTPKKSLQTRHFWGNLLLNTVVNFTLNLCFGALAFVSYDRMGLWKGESSLVDGDGRSIDYTAMPIVADVLLTTCLLSFFITIGTTNAVRKAITTGKALPIASFEYRRALRLLGVAIPHVVGRAAVFALYALVLVFPLTMFVFLGECNRGAMDHYTPPGTTNKHCYMTQWDYAFFKAGWCALLTLLLFPFIYLGGLNRAGLTEEQYQKFLRHHEASANVLSDDALSPRETIA
jgi:hypothetical protein